MSDNLNLDELINGIEKPVTIPSDDMFNLETNTAEKVIVEEETDIMENTTTTPEVKVEDKKEDVSELGLVDVFTYMTAHKDKITNAKSIDVSFKTVPEGKYLLFLGTEEKDANIYKIDTPNMLQLQFAEDATSITIYNSGVVIECDKQRSYIQKTNCTQFKLDNGIPIEKKIISKKSSKNPVKVIKINNTYDDVEQIKLLIKSTINTLYNKVKDISDINGIITEMKKFRPTKSDIQYQIKIDELMLGIKR